MPVFVRDDIRLLYVHVPKTGGTSIERFFEQNGFAAFYSDPGGKSPLFPTMKCSPQHLHAEPLRAIFNTTAFKYSFMTVRNPVDRLVSEYVMRATEYRRRPAGDRPFDDIDTWVEKTLSAYPDNPFMMDNHIRPQVEFWLPGADPSKKGCDVFRQENGFAEAWVHRIAERLGCTLPHCSVGMAMRADREMRVVPGPECIAQIRAFYRRDFEFFGYDAQASV